MKNFWYLFAAYTVIWSAMFFYLVSLSRKNKTLRDELVELQEQVQHRLSGKETT